MTQAQDFADLSQAYSAGNVALSNRNFIVDGAKEQWSIAQGASLPFSNGYSGAVMYGNGGGTSTVGTYSRSIASAGPVGRLGWPRAGNNFGVMTVTTPCTGTIAARSCPQQYARIEDVNLLESGSFTFSVVLCNQGASPVTISQITVVQIFGTGGSPSANVITQYPVNWVLPVGSWYRYSVRLDIPSIVGKTMGTNGYQTSCTQIEIDYPVGTVFTIADGFWQLEPCSPLAPAAGWPTAFEYRGQQAEAARVERYYEAWNNNFAAGSTNATTAVYLMTRYRTLKRITPTVTLAGTFTLFTAATANLSIPYTAIVPLPSAEGCQYNITTTGLVSGQAATLQNGTGSLITIDARL